MRERFAVSLLLIVSFVLFNIYSIATPLFEASDELWHYPLVQYLAAGNGLPIQRQDQSDDDAPWRQEGSQPPLYYALAALITAPLDSSNWREIRRLNPHSDGGVPTHDGNANAILHTPAEKFPWTGAALAAHVARFVSIALSTLTVFFAYLVGRELYPNDLSLRLGTLICTAFVPMFAFISGSINNDSAAVLFCTIGTWRALRVIRQGDLSIRSAVFAGLITALGILSKSSAIGLVGLFGLAGLFAEIRTGTGRGASLIKFGMIFIAVVALVSGWWFVRNQMLYDDWLGWNAFLDAVGRRVPPADLAQLWSEREGFVWAYWGVFGALNVIMPHIVYDALSGIVLLALVGGLASPIGLIASDRNNVVTAGALSMLPLWVWQLAACVFWVALIFVSLLRWTSLTPASQGRLMFPCIAVIAASIAYGLFKIHRLVLWLCCAALIALAVIVPFVMIAPVYAQPPALRDAKPAQTLNAVLGDAIELIGYDTPPPTVAPGEEAMLRLYWRVRAPLTRNYSVFVHLLDENDVVIAQRDMYPGQGTLATSELTPGYTWSDHYNLWMPRRAALPPKALRWEVGMYDLQSGERLTTNGASDAIRFGTLNLVKNDGDTPPLLNYNNGIKLLSYDIQPRTVTVGSPLTVTLVWRGDQLIRADYKVSLQLLGEQANKIAQHDSAPAGGNAPMPTWTAGQVVTDTHVLQLAKDAPPKVYNLLIVLYLPEDFSRLGAYDERGQFVGNQIELTRIRVR